jgi:hypothetical protein
MPSALWLEPNARTAAAWGYVPIASSERALGELQAHIRQGRSPITFESPAGMGKTTLLRVLLSRESRNRPSVVFVPFLHMPPEDIACWLLHLMGEVATASDAPEDRLLEVIRGRGTPATVLLVDELQSAPMASVQRLAEVGRKAGGSLVIVAAGQSGTRLDALRAKLGARVTVRLSAPLPADEMLALHESLLQRVPALPRPGGGERNRALLNARGIPALLTNETLRYGRYPVVREPVAEERSPELLGWPAAADASTAVPAAAPIGVVPHARPLPPAPPREAAVEVPARPPERERSSSVEAAPAVTLGESERVADARRKLHAAAVVAVAAVACAAVAVRAAAASRAAAVADRAAAAAHRAATAVRAAAVVLAAAVIRGAAVARAAVAVRAAAAGRAVVVADRAAAAAHRAAAAAHRAAAAAHRAAAAADRAVAAVRAAAVVLAGAVVDGAAVARAEAVGRAAALVRAAAVRAEAVVRAAAGSVRRTAASSLGGAPRLLATHPARAALVAAGLLASIAWGASAGIGGAFLSRAAPEQPSVAQVRVQVNARPWAMIRVDGVAVGPTPLSHSLAPGSHTFEAEFADGRIVRQRLEIGPERRMVSLR